jgi:ABC-type uncharacterized transport system auxiliary subunit
MLHRPTLNVPAALASGACIAVALLLLLAGGCSSFNRPYPDKALFAIDLGQPPSASTASGAGAGPSAADNPPAARPTARMLRVRDVHIAKPFDSANFVYKVGESRFTTDYYNGFVAEPDQLLTGELVNWLAASGEFGSVVQEGSTADYQLALESNVTALYADYTNNRSPQAVMELKVFVIEDAPSAAKVIFQKTYRETEPLSDNTPDKLVRGWDEAYRRILTHLLADLRASPQVASTGLGSRPR